MTVLQLWGRRVPVGGGGYFRLFPYRVTRWAMRRVNAQGRPVIVYLHPWELDPGQPRIPTSIWRGLRQHLNLDETADRLDRLLHDFDFGPLGEMINV